MAHDALNRRPRLRGGDGAILARGDDGTRDAAGMTLLAEDIDDVGKIGLGRAGDDIGRGRSLLSHPHVKRTLEAEGKAALGPLTIAQHEPCGRAYVLV